MGGGEGDLRCSKCHSEISCQVCDQYGHLADSCQWLYSWCRRKDCSGVRRLLITKTEKNPGRKFLRCQYSHCKEFQWLDEAIEMPDSSSCSAPRSNAMTKEEKLKTGARLTVDMSLDDFCEKFGSIASLKN